MTKQWTLTALTKAGEVVDTTTIDANDRAEALRRAKTLFMWQKLNYKFKLNLKK